MAIIWKRLTTVQKFIVWLQSLVLKVQSGINSYLSVSFGKLKNDNPGVFLLEFRHAIAEQNRPCECRRAMLLAGACAPAAWSAAVAPCYTATARVSRLFVIGSLVRCQQSCHLKTIVNINYVDICAIPLGDVHCLLPTKTTGRSNKSDPPPYAPASLNLLASSSIIWHVMSAGEPRLHTRQLIRLHCITHWGVQMFARVTFFGECISKKCGYSFCEMCNSEHLALSVHQLRPLYGIIINRCDLKWGPEVGPGMSFWQEWLTLFKVRALRSVWILSIVTLCNSGWSVSHHGNIPRLIKSAPPQIHYKGVCHAWWYRHAIMSFIPQQCTALPYKDSGGSLWFDQRFRDSAWSTAQAHGPFDEMRPSIVTATSHDLNIEQPQLHPWCIPQRYQW